MAHREAFIDTVCYPVLREVAVSLILRGELDAPGFFESERVQRAYLDGNWRGPNLGHINPAQEINAVVSAVKEKLMTRGEAAYRIASITDYEAFATRWKYDEGLFPAPKPEKAAELPPDQAQDGGSGAKNQGEGGEKGQNGADPVVKPGEKPAEKPQKETENEENAPPEEKKAGLYHKAMTIRLEEPQKETENEENAPPEEKKGEEKGGKA
jgi:hypothetical protein